MAYFSGSRKVSRKTQTQKLHSQKKKINLQLASAVNLTLISCRYGQGVLFIELSFYGGISVEPL